jgi:hypothetical protein
MDFPWRARKLVVFPALGGQFEVVVLRNPLIQIKGGGLMQLFVCPEETGHVYQRLLRSGIKIENSNQAVAICFKLKADVVA